MFDSQEYASQQLQQIIEAALLAAGRPLTLDQLSELFVTAVEDEALANAERLQAKKRIRPVLTRLQAQCDTRSIELIEVASGWRFQVKQQIAPHIAGLWGLRPSRYSRALLETLALIAYRQPITRGEIEKIRGVSVSTEIMKKLLDYGWVRVLGEKNTVGHPRIYGTTQAFLDHFSLKALDDLPTLEELKDLALEENQRLNEEAEFSMQERLKQADAEKQQAEQELRRLAEEALLKQQAAVNDNKTEALERQVAAQAGDDTEDEATVHELDEITTDVVEKNIDAPQSPHFAKPADAFDEENEGFQT